MAKPKTFEEWAQYYGWALAVLQSDPSLYDLFKRAVKATWKPEKFIAELRKTPWYKKYGETARKALVLKKADPASWRERVRAIYQEIMSLASTMGVHANWQTYWDMAEDAFTFGWTNSELRRHLASYLNNTKGVYGGEAGENEAQLRSYAFQMGVSIDDGTLKNWLKGIANGSRTLQDYKGYIQKLAISAYPGLAKQIQGGMTVRDIADPYMQSMANILEISPSTLSVNDPTIKKALAGVVQDANGNAQPGQSGMPLWQFEEQLKKDPRWLNTKNARRDLDSTGRGILQQFGVAW
jgi:hypothetical protein